MSERLKPCPFCGGNAMFLTITNKSSHSAVGVMFKIKCMKCGTELPKSYEITKWGVDNSNTTSLINMPIPESTYSEYFNDLYFIFSRQNTSVGKIEINGKKFYSNGYIAMYDEEG